MSRSSPFKQHVPENSNFGKLTETPMDSAKRHTNNSGNHTFEELPQHSQTAPLCN